MPDKRLVIIDGYSLLFRAFYGTRFLSTSDGRPTNALFGFLTMLIRLLEDVRPEAVVVALDAPGKTFRHVEYAEYKGTRRETPPELISQLEASRAFIAALQIPTLELTGYEADDVVGTVSRLAEENGYATTIVTGDMDSLQLVDAHVQVMTTKKEGYENKVVIYDPAAVEARYTFGPEFVTDYKALVGDASDNIPGVPGIGEKSAQELIKSFGTVEQILERIDEVPEKFRKKIVGNEDQMRASKRLATIVRDAPVEYDFAPYRLDENHLDQMRAMLLEYEFKSQIRRVEAALGPYVAGGSPSAPVRVTTEEVRVQLKPGRARVEELMAWVGERPYALAFPEGPTQKSMFDEETAGTAFVAVGEEAWAADRAAAVALFGARPGQAVGHDVKALYKEAPFTLDPPRMDTMLAGYVLQSGRTSYELDDLIVGYLDVAPPTRPEQRATALLHLDAEMRAKLAAEDQTRILDEIELPLVPILAEMESYGVAVDTDFFREYGKTLQAAIDQSQARVYEHAGEEFNIGSPKQIGEILFGKMGIPGGRKTKTGYSTDAEVLQQLAATHPIASEILAYRELTKLKGTYVDALPRMVAADGRIHTRFNQAVAATGRLSSNDPNLQNIPIRTELGRQIRKAFVAAPGFALASFDYSQIELRILAHLCRDENLITAFRDRVDVHTVTAALTFNVPQDQVTKEQRRLAKMLNYAVLYGVSDFGLAGQLGAGFSIAEAKELIRQYNERFPAVKDFTRGVVEQARSRGYTVTVCGRRRSFADIHAGNRAAREGAERQAMNAPIQGTAADLVKIAMIHVRRELGARPTRMLLQVHDELVFELSDGEDGLIPPIRGLMEGALPLDVPIEVDAKVGENWLEMTPVG